MPDGPLRTPVNIDRNRITEYNVVVCLPVEGGGCCLDLRKCAVTIMKNFTIFLWLSAFVAGFGTQLAEFAMGAGCTAVKIVDPVEKRLYKKATCPANRGEKGIVVRLPASPCVGL